MSPNRLLLFALMRSFGGRTYRFDVFFFLYKSTGYGNVLNFLRPSVAGLMWPVMSANCPPVQMCRLANPSRFFHLPCNMCLENVAATVRRIKAVGVHNRMDGLLISLHLCSVSTVHLPPPPQKKRCKPGVLMTQHRFIKV